MMKSTPDVSNTTAPHSLDLAALRPGRVRLRNGLRLAYAERGPASAETALLLVHGLSDSWRSFEPLLEHLPASLRSVAVTLRGHGESDHPDAGYRLADFASDLRQLLDALHLEAATIAGHALGGSVALQFAVDYPERALGLALLATFAGFRHNPAMRELQALVAQLNDPVDGNFIRDFQRATLARPIAEERLEQSLRDRRALPARVWKAILAVLMSAEGDLPAADLRLPVLLLWGDHDTFVPRADQEHLIAHITDSRLLEYPGAGHAFHCEDPVPTARELAAFAAGCQGRFEVGGRGVRQP